MASPQPQGTSPSPSPSPTTHHHASYFPHSSPNPTHYPPSPSPAEKFPDFSRPSPSIELISGFPRINAGSATEFLTANPVVEAPKSEDPFAAQRGTEDNPFTGDREKEGSGSPTGNEGGNRNEALMPDGPSEKTDRRLTNEWDASKTPPSRFQQRKGSVFATPNSRDGHVDRNTERDAKYHATLVEKGWAKVTGRRGSRGEKE